MRLLKMGFSGSVIIMIIIVMRSLIMHKIPKRAFVVFWDIALLRLLIPFYVPTWLSGLCPLKWLRFNFPGNEAGLDPGIELIDAGSLCDGVDTAKRSADSFVIRHFSIPLPDYLVIRFDFWNTVWFLGSVTAAAFFIFAYIKWHKEFKESIPVQNDVVNKWLSDHKLKRHLEIRYSDKISSPLSYGILKPVILMPKSTDWTESENLQYVLVHECIHIRYFDAVMKFALISAVCVHWFNPFVWIMYILANRDIELACDEAVIRMFGENTRKSYAMMLITMEEARDVFAPVANSFNKNAIETRIEAIIRITKKSKYIFACACILMTCIITLLSIITNVKPLVSSNEFFRFPLLEINSDYVQDRLRADGIDTDSNQYKAVVKLMIDSMDGQNEELRKKAITNNIGIKNFMQGYDEDGNRLVNGIAGLYW